MRLLKYLVGGGLLSMAVLSCEEGQFQDAELYGSDVAAIINGTRVTGNNRLSTVALVLSYGGSYEAFCTGTLITQNFVLTAAHCVDACVGDTDPINAYRSMMRVGIGQDDGSLRAVYEIASFHVHSNYYCSSWTIRDDIAILKLRQTVPTSVAQATPPMPPHLDVTASEVASKNIRMTAVGFGRTNANNIYSSGTKYEASLLVYDICPKNRPRSATCQSSDQGIVGFDGRLTNVCKGDSGGPAFFTRNGVEYVTGVTSYGFGDCNLYSVSTLVSDYYNDFIAKIVTDLPVPGQEICNNGIDDTGNGLVDCKDPQCADSIYCRPEICDNGIDDNGNGLIDCADPQCAGALVCQREICNDGIDNNGNGLVDCEDPQCAGSIYCRPEICDNGIDDNGNGLVDCDDPQCADALICQPEICNDGIDNNGNGFIDCQDIQCVDSIYCQPEICNDGIDNNGNGLVDCDDPQCANSIYCQREICNDNIDNTGNGLVDCDDPQCSDSIYCRGEICNDGIDNTGNGLIDCDDPQCANDKACNAVGPVSSCSAASVRGSFGFGSWLSLLGLFGLACFGRIRRARQAQTAFSRR